MGRRLNLEQRKYLLKEYLSNNKDPKVAIRRFTAKFPDVNPPPAESTPKRICDRFEDTGSVGNRKFTRTRTVSINFAHIWHFSSVCLATLTLKRLFWLGFDATQAQQSEKETVEGQDKTIHWTSSDIPTKRCRTGPRKFSCWLQKIGRKTIQTEGFPKRTCFERRSSGTNGVLWPDCSSRRRFFWKIHLYWRKSVQVRSSSNIFLLNFLSLSKTGKTARKKKRKEKRERRGRGCFGRCCTQLFQGLISYLSLIFYSIDEHLNRGTHYQYDQRGEGGDDSFSVGVSSNNSKLMVWGAVLGKFVHFSSFFGLSDFASLQETARFTWIFCLLEPK